MMQRHGNEYVQQEALEFPLNAVITVKGFPYYYRGYFRNPYGIITYYVCDKADGTKLIRISAARVKDMRLV